MNRQLKRQKLKSLSKTERELQKINDEKTVQNDLEILIKSQRIYADVLLTHVIANNSEIRMPIDLDALKSGKKLKYRVETEGNQVFVRFKADYD